MTKIEQLEEACICAIRCIKRNSTQAQKDWTIKHIEAALASHAPSNETERWMTIAREVVRGTYLPAEIPREKLFDKEAEAQALAEWLASHAPSDQTARTVKRAESSAGSRRRW